MTDTRYEYVVIEVEENEWINEISVNPLDSNIFYYTYNWVEKKGKIMKASQDGSNRTVLKNVDNRWVWILTIDLVLRKIIWNNGTLKTFASIDFDGNNFLTFGTNISNAKPSILEIFDGYIYYSTTIFSKSIFKTKVGVNDTQMDYLITSETDYITSFKIIDSSLQPNSTNRCINDNCSHICIPINTYEYRCVYPQPSFQNETKVYIKSVGIYDINVFLN
jgi:hypothetical protein